MTKRISMFRVGHPVYSKGGTTPLGAIANVEMNHNGFAGLDRARIVTPQHESFYITSDSVKSGSYVLGLTAVPTVPPAMIATCPFYVGQRLFRDTKGTWTYLGCVVKIHLSRRGDIFWAMTDLTEVASSWDLGTNRIAHGQWEH